MTAIPFSGFAPPSPPTLSLAFTHLPMTRDDARCWAQRNSPACLRRNQSSRSARAHHPHDSEERRAGADRIYRSAIRSISRSVDGAPLRSGGPSGLHWRFPRVRLHCHAAGAAKRAQAAQAMGISLLCRRMHEGVGSMRSSEMLGTAASGRFTICNKLPGLACDRRLATFAREADCGLSGTSMDLGRGCPYQCSFCTIINVQGHRNRCRARRRRKVIRENPRRTSIVSSSPMTTSP